MKLIEEKRINEWRRLIYETGFTLYVWIFNNNVLKVVSNNIELKFRCESYQIGTNDGVVSLCLNLKDGRVWIRAKEGIEIKNGNSNST